MLYIGWPDRRHPRWARIFWEKRGGKLRSPIGNAVQHSLQGNGAIVGSCVRQNADEEHPKIRILANAATKMLHSVPGRQCASIDDEHSVVDGESDPLGAALECEFSDDVCTMGLDRALRNIEHRGDFGVRVPVCNQLADFLFSRSESTQVAGLLSGQASLLPDQPTRQRRRYVVFTAMSRAYGLQ